MNRSIQRRHRNLIWIIAPGSRSTACRMAKNMPMFRGFHQERLPTSGSTSGSGAESGRVFGFESVPWLIEASVTRVGGVGLRVTTSQLLEMEFGLRRARVRLAVGDCARIARYAT